LSKFKQAKTGIKALRVRKCKKESASVDCKKVISQNLEAEERTRHLKILGLNFEQEGVGSDKEEKQNNYKHNFMNDKVETKRLFDSLNSSSGVFNSGIFSSFRYPKVSF